MKGDAGGTSLIMTHRASSPLGILLIVGLAGALTAPCRGLTAQALDSTGMPSLDLLAMEAGRASRRHPISTHGGARSAEGPFPPHGDARLHVEPDVHDVAVGDHVVLALDLKQPRVLHRLLRAQLHEGRVRNHLRANEAALEI